MVSFSFHFILFYVMIHLPVQPTEIKLNGNYFFPSNISLFSKKQPDSYFWIITDQNGSSSIFFLVVVLGLFWKFIFSYQFTFLERATATSVQLPRAPRKLRGDYFRFDLAIPLQKQQKIQNMQAVRSWEIRQQTIPRIFRDAASRVP